MTSELKFPNPIQTHMIMLQDSLQVPYLVGRDDSAGNGLQKPKDEAEVLDMSWEQLLKSFVLNPKANLQPASTLD